MIIGLIATAGLLTALLGRWMFGSWLNHVVLYGLSWGASLALFHAGLIRYYPLESETWLIIAAGWLSFLFGSATIVAARYGRAGGRQSDQQDLLQVPGIEPRVFRALLWIINGVLVIEAVRHALVISTLIGGLNNFNRVANVLYSLRVKQEIPGMIPYLSSTSLAACLLAGAYASRSGRLQVVSILPLVVTIADSVLNMSRGTMIIGGILFAVGYAFGKPRGEVRATPGRGSTFRRVAAVALALTLFIVGIEFVRSSRGINESYRVATTTLSRLEGRSFVTPSVFFYATGSHGVLNQYLKSRDERMGFGGYSLAPFWRIMAKLGFPTFVEQAQPFYYTPLPANNGTYLRELDADYGTAGIVAGPYLLGALASMFWLRVKRSQKLTDIMVLGHVYVVVGMSVFLLATQWGYWLVSLLFGLAAAFAIDRSYSGAQRSRGFHRIPL